MNNEKLTSKIREMRATIEVVDSISSSLRWDVDYLNQRKADQIAMKEASVESEEGFDESTLESIEAKLAVYEKVYNFLSSLIK